MSCTKLLGKCDIAKISTGGWGQEFLLMIFELKTMEMESPPNLKVNIVFCFSVFMSVYHKFLHKFVQKGQGNLFTPAFPVRAAAGDRRSQVCTCETLQTNPHRHEQQFSARRPSNISPNLLKSQNRDRTSFGGK